MESSSTDISISKTSFSRDLTLYGKSVLIEDSSTNKFIIYDPIVDRKISDDYLYTEVIYDVVVAPTKVFLAKSMKTGMPVAIKQVCKIKLTTYMLFEFIWNEFAITKYLSSLSQNVIKVVDYYEDDKFLSLVMEYCDRPNFFEELLENRYCAIEDEQTLKIMAFDILSALADIHSFGIIHCDIKPQNFLLFGNTGHSDDSFDENIILKLIDFGLCHFTDSRNGKALMKFGCGTHQYKAPEIHNDCLVDCSIDIWSFGVALYKMAVAYFPTDIKKYQYGTGPIPFRESDWENFSFFILKDLIEKCLKMNPSERIKAADALKHPWFDSL